MALAPHVARAWRGVVLIFAVTYSQPTYISTVLYQSLYRSWRILTVASATDLSGNRVGNFLLPRRHDSSHWVKRKEGGKERCDTAAGTGKYHRSLFLFLPSLSSSFSSSSCSQGEGPTRDGGKNKAKKGGELGRHNKKPKNVPLSC